MLLRLLPLLILLLLTQESLSQELRNAKPDVAPESCPVTKPFQTSLFVPPAPYEAETAKTQFWFGTDRLWTNLPINGIWKGLPLDTTARHSTFSQKLFWWRQGYNAHAEPLPKLAVSGKPLDSPVPPLSVARATNALLSHGSAMLVGLNFPILGCWEITGRYEDDELTFVVWVAN
jgi:hypothetical protein